jgi:hypothetical protein
MAGGGADRAAGARRDPHPILLPVPVPDADRHSSRCSSPRHSGGGHPHHCLVKVPREDPWEGRRRRGRREPAVRVGEGGGAGTGGSAQEGRGDRRSWAATAGGGAGTGVGGRHGMRGGTGGGDGRARRDAPLLWRKPQLSHTNNERRQRLKNQNQNSRQRTTKSFYSTVDFSKVDPLYMRRSVSFYREAGGLFSFREHPCVKRIKTECARLSSGNLQLGLHVIGAP